MITHHADTLGSNLYFLCSLSYEYYLPYYIFKVLNKIYKTLEQSMNMNTRRESSKSDSSGGFPNKKLHNPAKNSTGLRQSMYNIVIPLPQKTDLDESMYLLCNPLYGNTSLITEKEYRILKKFPEIDEYIPSALINDRYLTDHAYEKEMKLMERRYESERKPKDPRAAFVVTYYCNLRCTYCWSSNLFLHHEKCSKILDEKMVDAGFDAILRIPALHSVTTVSLYGGEPFLPSTLKVVKYLLEKGSEKGYAFHANTNGTHVKTAVPLLAQHTISGLGVTIDGCSDIHDARRKEMNGSGTFNRIVEGVDAALEEGIPISVRINVDAENLPYLPAFGDWIKEHGWAYRRGITFTISPVRPSIEENQEILTYSEIAERIISLMKESPSLLRIMGYEWEYMDEGYLSRTIQEGTELKPRPFYCSALYQAYAFDPFGDIYSCPRGVGDQRFCIGQFTPELQFNEHYEEWINRDVLSIPACRNCNLALVCGGGCAYEAYCLHHSLHREYCDRYRAFVKYGVPLFVWRREKVDKRHE